MQAVCAAAGAYCAARGVELGKLSVHHNLHNQEQPVGTTLLGVGNMEILKLNMDILKYGLTKAEEEVLGEVLEKFFNGMDKHAASWDDVEVNEYNKALGRNKFE